MNLQINSDLHVSGVRQTSAVDYNTKKQAPLWDETNSEVDYEAVKAALGMEAKLEADAIASTKAKHEAKLKFEQAKSRSVSSALASTREATKSYRQSRFKHFSDLAGKDTSG
eukprot:COSAG02_NODE_24104_length_697_cov_1.801003_1_plen_111_part_01